MEITDKSQEALDVVLHSNNSLFLTGKAGTGKSTLLKHIREVCTKNLAVIAPTGVAALNVQGQTIHKFFGFYLDITPDKIKRRKIKPKNPDIFKSLDLLIIDEVSMVRADLMDCIDQFLRTYGRDKSLPFGGVQMLFIGDLYQLPPVVSGGERKLFSSVYKSPYFFDAKSFSKFEYAVIELDKVYRQKDDTFVQLLNKVRDNTVSFRDIDELNKRYTEDYKTTSDSLAITLTSTNAIADITNTLHLDKLTAPLHTSRAVYSSSVTKEYFPTEPVLTYKEGAQVMLLVNDPDGQYVNGSLGTIISVGPGDVDILLTTGNIVSVSKYTWKVFKFQLSGNKIESREMGKFCQMPFKLAWAITIHKSQGKTFDNVILDVGLGAFAAGQVYVGLSRCTSLEGLSLHSKLKRSDIKSDKRITEYMKDKTSHQ